MAAEVPRSLTATRQVVSPPMMPRVPRPKAGKRAKATRQVASPSAEPHAPRSSAAKRADATRSQASTTVPAASVGWAVGDSPKLQLRASASPVHAAAPRPLARRRIARKTAISGSPWPMSVSSDAAEVPRYWGSGRQVVPLNK